MRKFIALLLTMMFSVSTISCTLADTPKGATKNEKFKVFEADCSDNVSGANHLKEIDLSTKNYESSNVERYKTINFNGTDFYLEYDETKEGYLYNNSVDYYRINEQGRYTEIGVNSGNGNIDWFLWRDVNYTKEVGKPQLTKEECRNIATEYFARFAEISEYELISEGYWDAQESGAFHIFQFVRVINGIQTSDTATIDVSIFGDVLAHRFKSLGEMKSAKLPSESDIKLIEENVDKKLNDIYSNVADEYEISYELPDPIFIRLKDGKYAFEYSVEVNLLYKDSSNQILSELTKLIVYID